MIVAVQFPYQKLVVIRKRCVLNDGGKEDPEGVEILMQRATAPHYDQKKNGDYVSMCQK